MFNVSQDTVDDDSESVRLALGPTLPDRVSPGTNGETTVNLRDDDDPEVTVQFEQSSYSVTEGSTQTVKVTLSADPERTVTVPLTTTDQGGATPGDYDLTPSVTFNPTETEKIIVFTATQDTVDDDDESVRLAFGPTLPSRVSRGTNGEATVNIGGDDDPQVDVTFGQGSDSQVTHTVPEGGSHTVTMTLSADPERTITVPIAVTHQGGATGADYDLNPDPPTLTFNAGETEKTIVFTATQDTLDDDGESVTLTYGNLPPDVSGAGTVEITFHIQDDDDPVVTVQFEHPEYGVFEGGQVTLAVVLSADPERSVTILLTRANQEGATDSDYSGVPPSVTFASGEVRQTFVFTSLEDTEQEDGESVKLGFGTPLPARVSTGANEETTVTIRDCEGGGIWCGTLGFGVRADSASGRKRLTKEHLDYDQFLYNGITYGIETVTLRPNAGGVSDPRPPLAIPERATLLFSLANLSATDPADRWTMPNADYLDWTLHIRTEKDGETLEAALPFNEAKFCCGVKWRWYGLDLDGLNAAWDTDQLYRLRIVEDPRADRQPQSLGPPLHLEVAGSNRQSAVIRWVRPQTRNDGVPPGVSYKIQRKKGTGSWDTEADVSEELYEPPPEEWLARTIGGLSPGTGYNLRVIAVNAAGDSEPSNVVTFTTQPDPAGAQQAESDPNSLATGRPGIDGNPSVGGTLTADISGISDADGLDDAAYSYQWLAEDAEIAGATGDTYTVVSGDVGKAIKVRVSFTDDSGNPETLTSEATEPVAEAALHVDSAAVNGATLVLTYSETLDEGVSLPAGAFTVTVGRNARPVAEVSVSGSQVSLTLSPVVEAEDMVTVDYTRPQGPHFLRDTLGNVAYSFQDRAVTNNTPAAQEIGRRSEEETADTPATGKPTITGTAQVGETLAANTSAIADADGLENATLIYQWIAGESDVAGATDSTYTLVSADLDKAVKVRVSFTDDAGNKETLTSVATAVVAPKLNSPATGQPTNTGTARVGETLTASTSAIADEDGLDSAVFTYQWQADHADIEGAANSTYTLTETDEGKAIKVRVSFTDDAGNEETLTSAATAAVEGRANWPSTGAPSISGVAQVGETLRGETTGIADADGLTGVSYSYQWLRNDGSDDTDIPGATSDSYTLVDADEGSAVKVRVSFTDDAGNEETLTSAATAEVEGRANSPATGAPTITGTAQVGETLTASTNGISDSDGVSNATFSYQ